MSSFQKKRSSKASPMPGTVPSLHNSQLLISTGVPSFDSLLGGGLPVGTILLIEEDTYNVYSKLLTKLYLAEGIVHKHHIYVSSLDEEVNTIINDLPSKCDVEKKPELHSSFDEKMKIAWQYQQYKANPKSSRNRFEHSFDLSNKMELTVSDKDKIMFLKNSLNCPPDVIYNLLLKDIKNAIAKNNLYKNDGNTCSNLLRIVISSFLSPHWGDMYAQDDVCNDWVVVTSFLTLLKSVVRNSSSSVLITIPSHLMTEHTLMHRIHGIVDFAIRLESFQGSEKETNPLFKDFHGILHLIKIAAINTLIAPRINLSDWAFNLKRRSFCIERLHLPPELQDTKGRSDGDEEIIKSGCMGAKLPKIIDF